MCGACLETSRKDSVVGEEAARRRGWASGKQIVESLVDWKEDFDSEYGSKAIARLEPHR